MTEIIGFLRYGSVIDRNCLIFGIPSTWADSYTV